MTTRDSAKTVEQASTILDLADQRTADELVELAREMQNGENPSAGDEIGRLLLELAFRKMGRVACFEQSQGLRRPANWSEVSALAKTAARCFAEIDDPASCALEAWICDVVISPPASWCRHARRWLDSLPETGGSGSEGSARLLKGILSIVSGDSELTVEGAETIEKLVGAKYPGFVLSAIARAAVAQTETEPMRQLADLALKHVSDALSKPRQQQFRLWLSLHVPDSSDSGDSRDSRADGFQLAASEVLYREAVHVLRAGKVQAARQIAEKQYSLREDPLRNWFGLILGLAALADTDQDRGKLNRIRQVAKNRVLAVRWNLLQAALDARSRNASAALSLCRWLESGASLNEPFTACLPLSGLLATVATVGRTEEVGRAFRALARFPSDRLNGDPELSQICVALLCKPESGEVVRDLAVGKPPLLSLIWDDLVEVKSRELAQLLDRCRFRDAEEVCRLINPFGEDQAEVHLFEKELAGLGAAERVLQVLCPSADLESDPSQYHCLGKLLKNGGRHRVSAEEIINAALELPESEMFDCCRALALLHWRWAMALDNGDSQGSGEKIRKCYRVANYLWRRLLGSNRFWQTFASDHDVDSQHLDEAREDIVDEIHEHHLQMARNHFVESDSEGARFHLRCLSRWDQVDEPPTGIDSIPEEKIDNDYGVELEKSARRRVEGWVKEERRDADSLLDDEEELRKLPKGISRNFEGAIAGMQPLLKVMPHDRTLLAYLVRLHTEFSRQLSFSENSKQAERVIEKGCALARTLAETHLHPKDAANPDNQIVCLAFGTGGGLTFDSARAKSYFEAHRKWGGDEEKIDFQVLRHTAQKLVEEDRYEEALAEIDRAESEGRIVGSFDKLKASCLHASAHYHGRKAAELRDNIASRTKTFFKAVEGQKRDAIDRMHELFLRAQEDLAGAIELCPGDDTYRSELELFERLAGKAEGDIVRRVSEGILGGREEDNYERMIPHIERFVHDEQSQSWAEQLISTVYLQMSFRARMLGDDRDALEQANKALEFQRTDPDIQSWVNQLTESVLG